MITLLGKSSSGKDSVLEVLKRKHNYQTIVSYTSRPMRKDDIAEVTYHFITEEQFKKLSALKFFAEQTENYGNPYGVAKEDCIPNGVVIVEKHGLAQLRKVDGLEIKSFYLYQSTLVRLIRMWKRGDKKSDILKRIFTDDVKFKGARKSCDFKLKVKDAEYTADAIAFIDTFSTALQGTFKQLVNEDKEIK